MAQAPEGPDWTRTAVAINTAAAHREEARPPWLQDHAHVPGGWSRAFNAKLKSRAQYPTENTRRMTDPRLGPADHECSDANEQSVADQAQSAEHDLEAAASTGGPRASESVSVQMPVSMAQGSVTISFSANQCVAVDAKKQTKLPGLPSLTDHDSPVHAPDSDWRAVSMVNKGVGTDGKLVPLAACVLNVDAIQSVLGKVFEKGLVACIFGSWQKYAGTEGGRRKILEMHGKIAAAEAKVTESKAFADPQKLSDRFTSLFFVRQARSFLRYCFDHWKCVMFELGLRRQAAKEKRPANGHCRSVSMRDRVFLLWAGKVRHMVIHRLHVDRWVSQRASHALQVAWYAWTWLRMQQVYLKRSMDVLRIQTRRYLHQLLLTCVQSWRMDGQNRAQTRRLGDVLLRKGKQKLLAKSFCSWRNLKPVVVKSNMNVNGTNEGPNIKAKSPMEMALSIWITKSCGKAAVKSAFEAFVNAVAKRCACRAQASRLAVLINRKRFLRTLLHFFHMWKVHVVTYLNGSLYWRRLLRKKKSSVFAAWYQAMAGPESMDTNEMKSKKLFLLFDQHLRQVDLPWVDDFAIQLRSSISSAIKVKEFYVDVQMKDIDGIVIAVTLYSGSNRSAIDLFQCLLSRLSEPGSDLGPMLAARQLVSVKTVESFQQFMNARACCMCKEKAVCRLRTATLFITWREWKNSWRGLYRLQEKLCNITRWRVAHDTVPLAFHKWCISTQTRLKQMNFFLMREHLRMRATFDKWTQHKRDFLIINQIKTQHALRQRQTVFKELRQICHAWKVQIECCSRRQTTLRLKIISTEKNRHLMQKVLGLWNAYVQKGRYFQRVSDVILNYEHSLDVLRILRYWSSSASRICYIRNRKLRIIQKRRLMLLSHTLNRWLHLSTEGLWQTKSIETLIRVRIYNRTKFAYLSFWTHTIIGKRQGLVVMCARLQRNVMQRALNCWWIFHRLWQDKMQTLHSSANLRQRKELLKIAWNSWNGQLFLTKCENRNCIVLKRFRFRSVRNSMLQVVFSWQGSVQKACERRMTMRAAILKFRQKCLKEIWSGWTHYANEQDRLESSAEHLQKTCSKMCMSASLCEWFQSCQQTKGRWHTSLRATEKMIKRLMTKTWAQWQQRVAERQAQRRLVLWVVRRIVYRVCSRVWLEWANYVVEQNRLEHYAQKVLRRWSKMQQSEAYSGWLHVILDRKRKLKACLRIMEKCVSTIVSRAWVEWVWRTHIHKRIIRGARQRRASNHKSKIWAAWLEGLRQLKQIRALRQQEVATNLASMKAADLETALAETQKSKAVALERVQQCSLRIDFLSTSEQQLLAEKFVLSATLEGLQRDLAEFKSLLEITDPFRH